MINFLKKHRFLILRRVLQIGILILFWGANKYGWNVLVGNLSTAKVLDAFYLVDPLAVIQIIAAGSMITINILIGTIIVVIFYSLIVGRSFCSWVCPVNILSDSSAWLRKKTITSKRHSYFPIAKSTRFYILFMALVLSVVFGIAAYEIFNPIGFTLRGVVFGFGTGGIFVLLGIFLFDLLISRNGFCGYLCPVGALYSFLSKFRVLKVWVDNDKCTSCMDCKKVCPEVQVLDIVGIKSGAISQGECTNCGRCIEVCNDKALKFTLKIK